MHLNSKIIISCALLAGPHHNCMLSVVRVVGWQLKYINNVCWDTFLTLYTQESTVLSCGTWKPCDNVRSELQGILVDVSDQADAALIEPSQLYNASGKKTDQAIELQSCKLGKWRWLEGDEKAGRRGDVCCFATWYWKGLKQPSKEVLDTATSKQRAIHQGYVSICFLLFFIDASSVTLWNITCWYTDTPKRQIQCQEVTYEPWQSKYLY